jgi:hypothetical protein
LALQVCKGFRRFADAPIGAAADGNSDFTLVDHLAWVGTMAGRFVFDRWPELKLVSAAEKVDDQNVCRSKGLRPLTSNQRRWYLETPAIFSL